jgi:hypothetical protein
MNEFRRSRVRFQAERVAKAMAHFMDTHLPLAEKVKDLSGVAIFAGDDDRGGKHLYFSPRGCCSVAELALEYSSLPCERPTFAVFEVFDGHEALVRKLLDN